MFEDKIILKRKQHVDSVVDYNSFPEKTYLKRFINTDYGSGFRVKNMRCKLPTSKLSVLSPSLLFFEHPTDVMPSLLFLLEKSVARLNFDRRKRSITSIIICLLE